MGTPVATCRPALTCQLSPSGVLSEKGQRQRRINLVHFLLLEPGRSRAGWRDGPRITQLVQARV